MRYSIQRDENGRWTITAYTDEGRLGATVICGDTDQVMRIFLMLEGHIKTEDPRTEDLMNENTLKVA